MQNSPVPLQLEAPCSADEPDRDGASGPQKTMQEVSPPVIGECSFPIFQCREDGPCVPVLY